MDADGIRKVAEWANFDKTALWHTRVGYNIVDVVEPLTENLLDEFKEALKLDPNFGAAHFALATASADLCKYDFAIEEMKEARRAQFNVSGGSDRRGAIFISKWQQARADTEEAKNEALRTLEEEMKKYPDDYPLIAAYMRVAAEAGRNKAVMSATQKLGTKLPDFLISEEAEDLHEIVRRAAQKTKRVGLLKKAYEIAIGKSTNNQDTKIALLDAAATLYVENQEDDQAIAMYQALYDLADEIDADYSACAALDNIAVLYFLGAWSKGGTTKERKEYLEKLERLEKDEHSADTNTISSTKYSHGLLLGLYYRLVGESYQVS